MKIKETHITNIQEKPIRFQEYGVGIFETITTKSALKKAIKKNRILINQKIANTATYISGGEQIELIMEKSKSNSKEIDLDLEVLFEDDFLAVVNKPAGIEVSGNKWYTIANSLPMNLYKSSLPDVVVPQPVHRLDYPTSGLLLIGKTSKAIQELSALFKHQKIRKNYIAICIGNMCDEGSIHFNINQKEAQSNFKLLDKVVSKRFNYLNLLKLEPKTGRRHQLRKHLAAIGHQILGDQTYGEEHLKLKGKGLYLHAYELAFIHPFTEEEINICKAPPKKFIKIFDTLKTQFRIGKFVET